MQNQLVAVGAPTGEEIIMNRETLDVEAQEYGKHCTGSVYTTFSTNFVRTAPGSADPFQTVFSVPSVHGGCGSYHAGGHGLLWCQVIEVKRTVSLALRDVARIAVKRDDIKILCAFI